ncbi:MAG: DNA polymerase III subunit delta' [Desulfotomaculaceae bacterium]|nr:DNA polymerase III subunit delta' [Desulfotomaculaceae bacterium]MDD4766879.1 DNA polymerase III subunit delta' [Desulfotomaculaceae bacterium]
MKFLQQIVGHKQSIKILNKAISSGRVAHAYLFAGPEGVGKETTAMAFARALLCSCPAGGDACGTCRECRQLSSGNHPDFYLVEPAGASIKIEQVREIQRRVPYCSYQGGRKIYLIRQAEAMTAEAANCILKTLEEPPRDTVFILLSARPQVLLPTILSRCQALYFKEMSVPDLIRGLVSLNEMPEEEARLYASLSGGSMGRALSYASGALMADRDAANALAGALWHGGPLESVEMAEKASESKPKAIFTLDTLACWYRDLLVWREAGEAGSLFNTDRVDTIKTEAARYDTGRILAIIEEIMSTKRKIEVNANTRLALETLFLRLSGGFSQQC